MYEDGEVAVTLDPQICNTESNLTIPEGGLSNQFNLFDFTCFSGDWFQLYFQDKKKT
jgi:hypothetical protein